MAVSAANFTITLERHSVALNRYLDYNVLGAFFVSEGLLSMDELMDILKLAKDGQSLTAVSFITAVRKRGSRAEEKMRRSFERVRERGYSHPGLEELYRNFWKDEQADTTANSVADDLQQGEMGKLRRNTKLLFDKFLPEILNHLDWQTFPLYLVQENLLSSLEYEQFQALLTAPGSLLFGVVSVLKAAQMRGSGAFNHFVSAVKKAAEASNDPGFDCCLSVLKPYIE